MGELRDPVPTAERVLLRLAVLEHVRERPGRVVRPVLHVGLPGGPARTYRVRPDERTDHALRADLVAAMLGACRRDARLTAPWAWLSRGGDLRHHEMDGPWLAAVRAAYDEATLDLTMVVVTRKGWRDPRSDLSRTWVRIRP